MNKYIKINELFPSISLPEELNEKLKNVLVEETIYCQKDRTMKLSTFSPTIIDSNTFGEFKNLIYEQQDVKICITPKFEKSSLSPLELLLSYKSSIEWELEYEEKDMLMCLLFKNSKITESEDCIVLTSDNKFMCDFKRKKLTEYLKELLRERFDSETDITINYEEDPKAMQEFLQNCQLEEMKLQESYSSSSASSQKTVSGKFENEKRKTIPATRPDNRRKKPDMDLIYGKNTDGSIIRIEELDNLEGEVVIQGCVFSLVERKLKQEDKKLVVLSVTDFTDTIDIKLFIKTKTLNEICEQIKEGSYLKIKGIVSYDTYSCEKNISNVSGISKAEKFLIKRMDIAQEKRVELHCHTKASAMDGVSDVVDTVRCAYNWGMPAIAITDHGVVHAFPDANHVREELWREHKKKCEEENKSPGEYKDFFKIIYGVEGYLVNDIEDDEPTVPIQKKEKTYHIIILAQNETGRVNLYKLISKSHLDYYGKRPRIPKSELLAHKEGLLVGSACEAGEIFQAITAGKDDAEIKKLAQLYDYLEIQPIGNNHFMLLNDKTFPCVQTEEDLREFNRKIVELGEKLNKPVVATCDVHFLNPEDEIYRRIIMNSKGFSDSDNQAPLYFRTTDEMIEEFSYLGKEKAKEVVVTNSRLISDKIEAISPVRPDKCPPVIENSDVILREICTKRAHELYGKTLPPIVENRMNKELDSIIDNGYAVMYIIAQKLVWKSLEEGYLVGSRGSVGSSFVAYLAGITEVNSLSPHYRCEKCFYTDFNSDEVKKYAGGAGCDMPDKICPNCGTKLIKDGFDIPYETFLGFNAGKEPDIDLNFSTEYQSRAHKHTEEIFGKGQTFKAGTIGAIADKTAYGIIRSYFENRGISKRKAEISRLVAGCSGVRKSTGQHPGGIVVLPKGEDINSFTPVQHPANDINTDIVTTHFDYHSIDHNLLKLDELGHADPTMIRHLQDLIGLDPAKIPLNDKKVMSLFTSPEALGLTPDDIFGWRVGTLGIPEFGTEFVEKMLIEANPQNFSDLVKIAGLGHGEDVWLGNAQELIKNNVCTISSAICCRDDIMIYLINKGIEPETAFKIMENVRKGNVALGKSDKWENWKETLKDHKVPDWYISSCEKIKYLFPKAHAAAYVMMAWRIAYCKLYYPLEYYTAYFSVRADDFSYETMCFGKEKLELAMKEMLAKSDLLTTKEQDSLKDMRIVQEMYARGFEFEPIDLNVVQSKNFTIIDGKIMPALTAIRGLGEKVAESIVNVMKNEGVSSIEELKQKAGLGDSMIETLGSFGIFKNLRKSNQFSFFDFLEEEWN